MCFKACSYSGFPEVWKMSLLFHLWLLTVFGLPYGCECSQNVATGDGAEGRECVCVSERQRQRSPIHWFTPKYPTRVGVGPGWKQELGIQFKFLLHHYPLPPSPLCIRSRLDSRAEMELQSRPTDVGCMHPRQRLNRCTKHLAYDPCYGLNKYSSYKLEDRDSHPETWYL